MVHHLKGRQLKFQDQKLSRFFNLIINVNSQKFFIGMIKLTDNVLLETQSMSGLFLMHAEILIKFCGNKFKNYEQVSFVVCRIFAKIYEFPYKNL